MATVVAFVKNGYRDKNQEAPVLIQYQHLYKKWRLNTGIRVNPDHITCVFDSDFEVWKLSSSKTLKPSERNRLVEANAALRNVYLKINQIILDLKGRSSSLSIENVKASYERREKPAAKTKKTVTEWHEIFIKAKEDEIGAGINSYRSTFEHFKDFSKEKGPLETTDLTKELWEEFRQYLLKKGLKASTVHKQFKNVRIFLNWIVSQDETDSIVIPSSYKRIKVKARYGDPIGLTVQQFLQFYNFDLSDRKYLERTRDVFVFAVSIGGPRHGDLKRLSEALRKNGFKINENSLSYFEGKTGNAHQEIVLNKIGLEILKKYQFVIPRVPTNQRMNKNLKAIAKLLEWNEVKYIPHYDNFGKLLKVEEAPLKDLFSTKFMRKTAATIDNMLGVPTKTSMKRTGHKTFAAYSRYVDVNKESMIEANKQWDTLRGRSKEGIKSEGIA